MELLEHKYWSWSFVRGEKFNEIRLFKVIENTKVTSRRTGTRTQIF